MLNSFHDVFLDSLSLVEGRFLRQVAHRVARAPHHVALILLIQACNNLHQRRLTGTVKADDANLSTIEETEVDVFKHLLLILLNGLADPDH